MDSSAPYVSSRFYLKARIGSIEFNDVVSFSSTFGLNMIPIGTLTVATGREVRSGKFATIHDAKKQLKAGDEAVVTLSIRNGSGNEDRMEEGLFTIFRGKFAGIGYKRSYNSAGYVIHLVHWLDDLNRGSMINGNWMPGAPYDMAQNAGYYALSFTEGDTGFSSVPAIDVKGEYINESTISKDLWNEVLRKVFLKINEWPSPRYQGISPDDEARSDAIVKTALDRMAADGPGKKWYKPLALNLEGLTSGNVTQAIKTAIAKDALDSFAYTTFWNKLVGEYAPQFYFAISPSVDFALPIPFFAGLDTPGAWIYANEYNYADFNASVLQQLESVDIFYSQQNDTGLNIGPFVPGISLPSFKLPLGFYPPTPTRRGYKMLKEPPNWMTNVFCGPAFVLDSTNDPRDTASAENVNKQVRAGYDPPAHMEIVKKQSKAANRFAEHWYKTEILYQRHGEMSGKLRFDIAPGSIVAIETPPRDVERAEFLYATATQVSFAIDAERAAAGTSFTLAHIRTEEENADNTLVAPKPPMYSESWSGAPLAVRS